jgi:UDP-2-acetamido-2,6-beta-L-arabino-hexul-4-ose reductase
MKVAITGETGFLGYHLTQYLRYQLGYEVVSLSRNYLDNIQLAKDCDWLIHCAGVNRGNDVYEDNFAITRALTTELYAHGIYINVAFISSVLEDMDTPYGKSKQVCKHMLATYCSDAGTEFISYRLPNLFGPFGKPNYNSVVATFCHNIVNGIDSQVNDVSVQLCYVYDAINTISKFDQTHTYVTTSISIKDLYQKLHSFHQLYSNGIIPELTTKFDIQLFNTYRSFTMSIHKFIRYTDERGYLIELLKSNMSQSQIFVSVTKPGVTRGNHFHFNKIERFCVLKGSANISMRKLGSDDIIQYIVTDDMDMVIDMPVLYTHNIANIGDSDLVCMFWTNEIFDKEQPDTYFIKV